MPPIPRCVSTGVYKIRNAINGKVYIGSTVDSFASRFKGHVTTLKAGTHRNRHLQAAWNKYGEFVFEFSVLERCRPSECVTLEQRWLDAVGACDPSVGYNISPTAGNSYGVKHTVESRANMSKSHKGKPLSPGHRDNMVAAIRGAYQRKDVKKNVSDGTRKALADPRVRAKMGSAWRGKHLPPSIRRKQGLARMGKGLSIKAAMAVFKRAKGG